MAAKALDPKVSKAVLADWRTGHYSVRELGEKHKIHYSTVAKLCKGVDKDLAPIVNAGIQYRQGIAGQDQQIVNSVDEVVDNAVALDRFFKNAAVRNVESALSKIGSITDQQEHKHLADTILKGREAAIGKSPDTAIQINNGEMPVTPEQRAEAIRKAREQY